MLAKKLSLRMRKIPRRPYKQAISHLSGQEMILIQPLTYVNNSGAVVRYFVPALFSHTDIIVVCDNLDLPVGTIRIRKGGSSAGHKGLKSLINALDSSDFIRVYIGIGRPQEKEDVVEYVLSVPSEGEEYDLLRGAIHAAAEATLALSNGVSVEEVSRAYNRRST